MSNEISMPDGLDDEVDTGDEKRNITGNGGTMETGDGETSESVRVDSEDEIFVKQKGKNDVVGEVQEEERVDGEEKRIVKQVVKKEVMGDVQEEERVDGEEKKIVKQVVKKEAVEDGQEEKNVDGKEKKGVKRVIKKEVMGDVREEEKVDGEEKNDVKQVAKKEVGEYPPHVNGRKWHAASRDWAICGISVSILLIIFIIIIIITDVMKNSVLSFFFICCIGLLGVVGFTFLRGHRRLKDYQAITLFHVKNGKSISEKLHDIIVRDIGQPEQRSSVVGKTFGLFSTQATFGLPDDEVIELNEIRMNSGLPVGLYLLVKAKPDSTVWTILKELLQS